MNINLNCKVRVTLTEHAMNIMLREQGLNYSTKKIIKDDMVYETQLWVLMQTFGPYIYNGGPLLFTLNQVEILD